MRAIIVVNAGSSSLKVAVYGCEEEDARLLLRARVERRGSRLELSAEDGGGAAVQSPVALDASADAFEYVDAWLRRQQPHLDVAGYGHRIVHGGPEFDAPVVVDASVLERLEALTELAPLHQPHNLAPIRAAAAAHPQAVQIACFDTAFHRGHAPEVDHFALPPSFYAQGVRRYGFHGLSFQSIASSLPTVAPHVAEGRVVVAHLGNGASLCAMRGRRSVDTTMSFSALDGLVMGTRCGSIDPGVLLYLLGTRGMRLEELERLLYAGSGLLGLSGLSSDMRDLLASPDASARLAVDAFVLQAQRQIAAMAAVLGGIDAIVFTGGIGENSVAIRERIGRACAWLGVEMDEVANARGGPCITRQKSPVSGWVIPTDEEGVIAEAARAILR
ncbi:MAG TPA: acetate/propionate family kinase [Candidatus Limnocylindrales bacterium]|nr:acetate/propionate family kinase [Candidatus Limnocylindrales bacterium]